MIRSKKDLEFYMAADMMMNLGHFYPTLIERIKFVFSPNVVSFLRVLRKTEYYSLCGGIRYKVSKEILKRLSIKFGFSISPKTFGYGLYLPHWGTVVVGGSCRVGNYSLLNVGTCITDSESIIGDAFFMGTNAVISNHVNIGHNVCLGANSCLLHDCREGNRTLVGTPAKPVKIDENPWYVRLWPDWKLRVDKIERLKVAIDYKD